MTFQKSFSRRHALSLSVVSLAPLLAVKAPHAAPKAAPGKAAPRAGRPAVDAAGQRVTRALESALRTYITSPGGRMSLSVRPTARAREGYFSEVAITARPARVRKLELSSLEMRARNVRVDVGHLLSTGKVRTLSSQTSLRAVVTEDDLTRLLARGKRTRDMGLRVRYIPGNRMSISGRLNYTLINGPVTGTARLRLGGDYKVYLDILSLQLRGAEVPGFVKNQLSSRINPVIDYQDIPFRPQFRGITVSGPRATLRA